jgi:titin
VDYYYTVRVRNMYGWSGISNEVKAFMSPYGDEPDPVVLVSATGGAGKITLEWISPTYEGTGTVLSYTILRNTTTGWGVVGHNTTGLGMASWVDNAAIPGVVYTYKIVVANDYGAAYNTSGPFCAIATPPATFPTAPLDLRATAGNRFVLLQWSPPASDGGAAVASYRVYRSTTPGGETLLITLGNVLTYTDTGLANGQIYYYKISAVNSVGEGVQSNETSATPVNVPSAPTIVSATPGDGQVVLVWTAPSNGGATITHYSVCRGTAPGGETLLITLEDVLTYTDTGLTNGQPYFYKVSASNAVGAGPNSSETFATPNHPVSVPSAPQGFKATAGNAQITLNWSAPATDGGGAITGYRVYRGTNDSSLSVLTSVTMMTFVDTGLVAGQTYYYEICATNQAGEGAMTTVLSATPPPATTPPTDNTMLFVGIGAVAVLAIAGAAFVILRRPK